MDTIKEILNQYARPFLVKHLTRWLTYGSAAISAKLAITAPDDDTVTKAAGWIAAVVMAALAMLIDWIHHRKDRADGVTRTSNESTS